MADKNELFEIIDDITKADVARLQRELLEANINLLEKERTINFQHALIQQQLHELERKQKLKEEMLVFFYLFRPLLLPLMWLIRPVYRQLKPRLGVLNQYPPHELYVPANYSKSFSLAITPKISIVTPSYNQSEFLERTLNSVLNQAYPDLEF